ncbi:MULTISPECIES: hypothetical protein [Halomonas]|uniref:Uncharacterized protein n=1 Tax=Halomonas halophila TaxID=29573 RepID=A0ABQ0U6U8_9GAMM|nr:MULTISPECIES: hypothetical protein [Halomonas]MDR5891115.1 hypothetical protein [Halomonas salina]WJY08439.1 hypothetical protein QWG60_05865 [Halomonas halophila]GEK74242.1 hypothetical protein HHA04nite_27860 [Halomonas halophila]
MTPTFLEVSGRQVGKTHDLEQAAIGHIKRGGVAIIVAGEGLTDRIRRRVPDAMVIEYGTHTDQALLEQVSAMEQVRWFFDEFDWYQAVPVVPGGYYCTTARFIRSENADPNGDTLLTLANELRAPTCQRSCPLEVEKFYPPAERDLLLRGKYQEVAT